MNLTRTLTIILAVCHTGISQVAFGQSSTRTALPSSANVAPSLPSQLPGGPVARSTLSDQGRTFPNRAGSPTIPTPGPSTSNEYSGSLPAYSASTDQKLADLAPERTHGWEYDENNELVYIIQVSPGTADQMLMESKLNSGNTIYASSTMPIELVGRVRKITMQIGTEVLPRTPSLEQLRRTKRLDENQTMAELDKFGSGSIARVEPDGAAMEVQRTLPASPNYALPNTGNRNPNGLPTGGLDATGSQRRGQVGLGSQFLDDAGAPSSLPAYDSANSNPMRDNRDSNTRPGLDGRDAASERELVAQLPSGLPKYDVPGRTGAPYNGQSNQGYDPPSMTNVPPRGTSAFGQAPTAPDFSNRNTAYEQSLTSVGTNLINDRAARQANDGFLNRNNYDPLNRGLQANNRQDMQPAGSTQQPPDYDRMADARYDATRLPATGSTFPSTKQSAESNSASSPSEIAEQQRLVEAANVEKAQAEAEEAALRNQNNLIGLFCVLSLVVNCYLFMLIRKLLTRYRTLLTNVRSQAA